MSYTNRLKKITRVFYLGTNDTMPFEEVQKTFLFNLFLMIGFPFIIPGIPINFSNGQYHLAYMNCALLLLYCLGLYCNIRQQHLWVRQLVAILATLVAMTGPVFYRNGTEYNMLINLMSAVVLFDGMAFVVFSLAVIACVTYVRVRDVDPATITAFSKASPYINIFWSQFLYVLCVYAFKYIYVKYQKQLALANERLRQSSEAKDRILQVVAHDLRTPVGGISALSQMLIDEKHEGNEKSYLQMIHQASSQSLSLITNLLTDHSGQPQELSVSHFNVNTLVSEVFDLMQHKALAKGQLMTLSMEEVPQPIAGDRDKILRVMQNLVSNAIKFTPPQGDIRIFVKAANDGVAIGVADNGMGIPAALQKNLFTMSSQVKRAGTEGEKSFGIGLTLSKQIIDAHMGHIEVESREGYGTTVTVYLMSVANAS